MNHIFRRMFVVLLMVLASQAVQGAESSLRPLSPGLTPDSADVERAIGELEARLARHPGDIEAMLLQALIYHEARRYEEALAALDRIGMFAPNFHLARMIKGDILLSRVEVVRGIGHTTVLESVPDSRQVLVEDLREEARVRLRANRLARERGDRLPAQLLRLGEETESAILVDKRLHRLYLFRNGGEDAPPELVHEFYVSTGRRRGNKQWQGDLRTPEGVYFVTRYTPDSQLPEKYGVAAFPINYPNALDRYRNKTGGGIWLHGMARRFFSRPPLDSEGCVVMSNGDLERIIPLVHPGFTPFVIAREIEWLEPEAWWQRREELMEALADWMKDRQSGDLQLYRSHYAPNFWVEGSQDVTGWVAAQQRRLALAGESNMTIRNLSLLTYPQEEGSNRLIVLADFRISLPSAEAALEPLRERLYWEKNGDQWYVLHQRRIEGQAVGLARSRISSPMAVSP